MSCPRNPSWVETMASTGATATSTQDCDQDTMAATTAAPVSTVTVKTPA